MGISIGTLWLSMVAMTYAMMRQKLNPASWQWALRLGLWLSLVGAAAGEHRRLRFFVRVAGLAGTSRPGAPQAGWSHSTGSVNHDGFHVRWVSPDSFPFTAEFRE